MRAGGQPRTSSQKDVSGQPRHVVSVTSLPHERHGLPAEGPVVTEAGQYQALITGLHFSQSWSSSLADTAPPRPPRPGWGRSPCPQPRALRSLCRLWAGSLQSVDRCIHEKRMRIRNPVCTGGSGPNVCGEPRFSWVKCDTEYDTADLTSPLGAETCSWERPLFESSALTGTELCSLVW